MSKQVSLTILVALAILSLLLWQHLHEGVPRHYLLHRADMPSFSNWWGAVLLPALTWYSVGRVNKRAGHSWPGKVLIGFFASAFYGITMSVAYMNGWEQITSIMAPAIFLIALFVPIYQAEYFLGFVLGMTYTFGAVLPILFAIIFALAGFVIYRFIRGFTLTMYRSMRKSDVNKEG